jgi:DNA-binding response OmpR family regulator
MKQHIVVIESDPSLLSEMAVALENQGYRVTGFEALTTVEELAALHPALFIVDERLPTVSGHIICIMLHSNLLTRAVPQILIASSPLLGKFAALGEVDGSLRKPFAMDQLLTMVAGFFPSSNVDI